MPEAYNARISERDLRPEGQVLVLVSAEMAPCCPMTHGEYLFLDLYEIGDDEFPGAERCVSHGRTKYPSEIPGGPPLGRIGGLWIGVFVEVDE